MRPLTSSLAWLLLVAAVVQSSPAEGDPRPAYHDPAWRPRANPTLADLLAGFHPPSPAVGVGYDTPGFAGERLHPAPAPGVYPRVLVTPEDIEAIRARVAQGDEAPPEFRATWKRVADGGGAFAALVMKDDARGRALADGLVERLRSLEPKLDRLDALPDAGNLWSAERSLIALGDPDPPAEIWSLLDYDYLHGWMTAEERTLAERVIGRLVKGRISNFLAEPDHFMINNHKGFGMEFIRLMLLVEGTPAFPADTFRLAAHKCHAMLDWYLSPDGMCYESIKGWINTSAFVAVARRDPQLLRHDHLVAKVRFFRATLRREGNRWQIREEMRASAFHVIWLMRWLYPEDREIDLLYHASLASHPFLTDPTVRWPEPVGVAPELMLLFAGGGSGDDRAGKLANWETQEAIDALALPVTWHDPLRGYLEARNSWRIGDLHLGFVNKQDFYYGGHEGSEANRVVLWKDGVNWIRDEDLLAVKATGLQNMMTVDGRGLSWPPVPGVWLGVQEGPHGISAAGDARLPYAYGKVMQVHPLGWPSARVPYTASFTEKNFDLTRDLQVAFHPGTVAFNDGYAHTDYGPWSGETRLVEHYRNLRPVETMFRTVHLARGAHPYVLVMDDARMGDDDEHLFEASFNLPDGAAVVDATTTEVRFQEIDPSGLRESSFLIAASAPPVDPRTGRPTPRRGDPLLLVRVLHRDSTYGYPVPRVQVLPGRPERPFQGFTQLVVPAISRSPGFKVMFYPHRHGDPLPRVAWDTSRTRLEVVIGNQRDSYRFATADAGRTVFEARRGESLALSNATAPARPVLVVRGDRFDPSALRTTRREGEVPVFATDGTQTVAFEPVIAPAAIHATLDGSEPGPGSPRVDGPIVVTGSATLRAVVVNPDWPGVNRTSAETVARFEAREPTPGADRPPVGARKGLRVDVHERVTRMWDDRGFFRADLVMLPDLDREGAPLVTALQSRGFALPHAVPALPITDQSKGFHRFRGWFHAEVAGVHDFAVDSCGPVLLAVGGQDAIVEIGVFHQQQAVRRGSVVLGRGWHAIELVVTDPLFWNIATTGPMPLAVTVRGPGESGFEPVPASRLAAEVPEGAASAEAPIARLAAESDPGPLEPGLVRRAFDRWGMDRDPAYLDIDGLEPRRVGLTDVLVGNDNPMQVVVHEGWFEATTDGIHQFHLPARRERNAGLGEFRAAYQSQLRIGGEVVVQRGVAGRVAEGRVHLERGWHRLSLRLGSSPARLEVTTPEGRRLELPAAALRRRVADREDAERLAASADLGAFVAASLDLERWDGSPGVLAVDPRARWWLASNARREVLDGRVAVVAPPPPPAGGPGAVDLNLTRFAGRIPLKVHGIRLFDPEFTVGLWVRSDSGEGRILGKEGINTYGKSYRTISVRLEAGGRLRADPGVLRGGRIEKGRWHHVVLSATPERLALYLDGKPVASGPGAPGLPTDALDFLADHAGAVSGVQVHGRELTPEEIRAWHAEEAGR